MKKVNSIILILTLAAIVPAQTMGQAGPPWIKTNVGYNYIFRAIDFPGGQNDIGYMAGESLTYQGDGIVLKTTDGGTSWSPVWTGGGQGIEGASFVDVNTGFIAGWPKLGQGWSGFGKTTDGGATWTSLPVANDLYYFTDVVFKDANHGILIGATNTAARVWVTSNGGSFWSIATGLAAVPYHACYVSGDTYFLTDNDGNIQKSEDNGMSWTTMFSIPGLILTGIDFYNDSIGMACGDNGVIVKTYDGGNTWEAMTVGVDIWHDFGWETADHVFVCGTPEIVYESTNGGSSWVNGFPASAHNAALYECTFTPNGSGFICGSQGTLLKREPDVVANFTASATSICAGNTVSFTDQSTGGSLTYHWSFEGGTPSTSTLPNPVITYDNPGTFDVQLIVDNGNYDDTLLKVNYITVTEMPAAPSITSNGYTLTSDVTSGNQWYFEGNEIPGATGQNYTADQTGIYWDVVTQNGCSSDTSNHIYVVMTGSKEPSGTSIRIYPVPNNGLFTVQVQGMKTTAATLTISNSLGVQVYETEVDSFTQDENITIDLRSFPAGFYFVTLSDANGKTIRQMLKF
jgi:photosystem II stability/assembly factor-like uncharacterized protein